MGGKILRLYSWSSIIWFIFLQCLIAHVQISNAYAYCQYYKDGHPGIYMKPCPSGCCSIDRPTAENATCCDRIPTYPTLTTTSTFSIFGYSWWIVFLAAVCFFTALSILIHYTKRIHVLKHWKNFNPMVKPVTAYTISKGDISSNGNDATIIFEQTPPSYASAMFEPPPSYVSTKKNLE